MSDDAPVQIIGGGLAGCEAALQLADRGIAVRLFEMKPNPRTEAQTSDALAELVCSNSLRGTGMDSAVGVIKEEMRRLGGRLIRFADEAAVPAGGALAVDRDVFSAAVTAAIEAHPNIELCKQLVTKLPSPEDAAEVIVATGPLTAGDLAKDVATHAGSEDRLYFYDAIAPIIDAESIDETIAYRMSRYNKGDGDDYINCPMDQETYERFVDAMLAADKVTPREFEKPKYFEGCLPVEVMAERGRETLRFGCMKPVGLEHPKTGERPWAVVQLRTENKDKTAYNLVGFQTRMKWGPQKEVFRMIPGLQNAEFLRMGTIHRNTYIDSPSILDAQLRLKGHPHLSFAGQITGVEGYVESIACGLIVGLMTAARRMGTGFEMPPSTTAFGALYAHVLGTDRQATELKRGHVPSNVHWGLFPALEERAKKKDRKRLYGERALADFDLWRAGQVAPLFTEPAPAPALAPTPASDDV